MDSIERELGKISATLENMEKQLSALSVVRDDVIQAKAVGRFAMWAAGVLAPIAGFLGSVVHGILKHGS